jgi:hypothetical protein
MREAPEGIAWQQPFGVGLDSLKDSDNHRLSLEFKMLHTWTLDDIINDQRFKCVKKIALHLKDLCPEPQQWLFKLFTFNYL